MNKVQAACNAVDGQASLSRLLDVTAAAVNQWVKGLRPVPPKHCVAIERVTEGTVTRRDLRPHDWHLIWPELVEQQPKAGEDDAAPKATQSPSPPSPPAAPQPPPRRRAMADKLFRSQEVA